MKDLPAQYARNYIHGRRIGKGAFSEVFKATKRSDKSVYAVKVIQKARLCG